VEAIFVLTMIAVFLCGVFAGSATVMLMSMAADLGVAAADREHATAKARAILKRSAG